MSRRSTVGWLAVATGLVSAGIVIWLTAAAGLQVDPLLTGDPAVHPRRAAAPETLVNLLGAGLALLPRLVLVAAGVALLADFVERWRVTLVVFVGVFGALAAAGLPLHVYMLADTATGMDGAWVLSGEALSGAALAVAAVRTVGWSSQQLRGALTWGTAAAAGVLVVSSLFATSSMQVGAPNYDLLLTGPWIWQLSSLVQSAAFLAIGVWVLGGGRSRATGVAAALFLAHVHLVASPLDPAVTGMGARLATGWWLTVAALIALLAVLAARAARLSGSTARPDGVSSP